MKPGFQRVWEEFPDHVKYPTMGDLYRALGGNAKQNINAPGFGENGNACASRLSVAFNRAGAPISTAITKSKQIDTLGTADGSRIIFRVADFRKYLVSLLGNPVVDDTRPYGDAFNGKTGIIAFSVKGWQGATGHIALWDGSVYREPYYDDYASYVDSDNQNVRTVLAEFWRLDR